MSIINRIPLRKYLESAGEAGGIGIAPVAIIDRPLPFEYIIASRSTDVMVDYALETVIRILNMVPTKKVDKTPYELWYEKVPNLSYLKETMGYYFYFPPENKIVVARYVEFLEKNLLSQEVSGRAEELEEIQDKDTSPSENTSKIPMEVEGFEPPQEEVVPIVSGGIEGGGKVGEGGVEGEGEGGGVRSKGRDEGGAGKHEADQHW
ncbi:hypothetical protein Tco_1404000 [Tanacetum coccineum]